MALNRRKISVVTVSRSDYGLLRPVLLELIERDFIDVELIVTGMHIDHRFGDSLTEIHMDGISIAHRVDTGRVGDDAQDVASSMGRLVIGMAEVLKSSLPDILVLLGDRFEMLAAAVASLPFNIAIAHIHGGEASFGAIDDAMRNAITKLSHIHFASTREYANRILQMGEREDRVFVSGAPGLDNLRVLSLPSAETVAARFGFCYDPSNPPLLATFHPESRSIMKPQQQIDILLRSLSCLDIPILFTMPNADPGGLEIAERIRKFCSQRRDAILVTNLGTANYFAMLKVARAMVGNSSSGIIEAASFGLPVVNIGDRQKGRATGANVVHCPLDHDAVLGSICTVLSSVFTQGIRAMENIYGTGQAAGVIAQALTTMEITPILRAKEFVDRRVMIQGE